MTQCCHKISPLFNRMVIFRINDDANHGHPEPWLAPEDYCVYHLLSTIIQMIDLTRKIRKL